MRFSRGIWMCACALWAFIGCLDTGQPPVNHDTDCSATGLTERIDEELSSVNMDAMCDAHLLQPPWIGERASCASTDPDPSWPEGPWIKTREYCVNYSCVILNEWVETNFGTGFGVLKDGKVTLDTMIVQNAVETDVGWDIFIACGCNDGAFSLHIPLRIYFDQDLQCLGEINVAVDGYLEFDALSIKFRIMDDIVQEPFVEMNDLYVHVEVTGQDVFDSILSKVVSGIASQALDDLTELFGQTAKERVEAAYAAFKEDCPSDAT